MTMTNDTLKKSFGKISFEYDAARPDYPSELIHDLITISGIHQNAKILEIGSGTGKATKPFAEKGYTITCLDISPSLLAVLKKNLSAFSHISYIVSSFEDAVLKSDSFDLVFAAQTFHWIDPSVGYKKVHAILKKGGYVAFFSNFYSVASPLYKKVEDLCALYCPEFSHRSYGTLNDIQQPFEASGLFHSIQKKEYSRNLHYSKAQYLALLNTFSWISTLDKNKRHALSLELEKILAPFREPLIIPVNSILLVGRKS